MLRHYQSTLAAVGLHLGAGKPANLQAKATNTARAGRNAGLWDILQVCGHGVFAASCSRHEFNFLPCEGTFFQPIHMPDRRIGPLALSAALTRA